MSSRSEFTYISTFAGCGGSSLGYKWAGGKGLAAVEFDANAAETYRLNFPNTPVLQRDIATVTAEELFALTGLQVGELDILDGSPPCQGFSTAGKREFSDPRNSLFKEYVRLIEGLQPKVFVMENVSGMVKGKMKLAFRDIMLALKATGYTVRCKLLNAMYFEVPQSRERLIWIGVRGDIGREPGFPEPVGKPKTVREAFADTDDQDAPPLSDWLQRAAALMEPGNYSGSNAEKAFRKVRGKTSGAINTKLLSWDRVSCTLVKSEISETGLIHPDKKRYCSIGELSAIGSFPQAFKFTGNRKNAVERIGNSVPPRFMYHIAAHIRDHVLPAPEGA